VGSGALVGPELDAHDAYARHQKERGQPKGVIFILFGIGFFHNNKVSRSFGA
jgi:hypothetical protein